jgi:hypothetical protein
VTEDKNFPASKTGCRVFISFSTNPYGMVMPVNYVTQLLLLGEPLIDVMNEMGPDGSLSRIIDAPHMIHAKSI